MADSKVTIRTRKFLSNRLLNRKQFVCRSHFCLIWKFLFLYAFFSKEPLYHFSYPSPQVIDVIHVGVACPSKAELRDAIAKMYKVKDSKCVAIYGVKTGMEIAALLTIIAKPVFFSLT